MYRKLTIDSRRCKSCGLCVRACPHRCLEISGTRNRAGYLVVQLSRADACVACGACVLTCPEPQSLALTDLPEPRKP
ncbi:MAG: 4Fe-4S binding protein [Proteobacteria bacterium]|nr:4Fe-4S binding protein [Pseudomonadota bacterium]